MTEYASDRTEYAQSRRHLVARCPRNGVDHGLIAHSAIYLASVSLLRIGKLSALAVRVGLIGFS